MKRFHFLEAVLLRDLSPQEDVLQAWRERVLDFILLAGTVMGTWAYIASMVFVVRMGQWHLSLFYTLVYAGVIAVTLVRRIPYRLRAGSVLVVIYTLGLISLLATGPRGFGRVYLFTLLTVTSVLLGLRAGVAALILSGATLGLHGWMLSSGYLQLASAPEMPFSGMFWAYSIAVFLMLGTVSAVPLAVLVRGLETTLNSEKALTVQLHQEVAERRRAEEEIRHRAETLEALHETALDLIARKSLKDLLRAVVVRAVDLLEAKGGCIYLYRLDEDDLLLVLSHNLEPDFSGALLQRGNGLSGRVLETGRAMAIADYSHWAGRSSQYEQAAFTACVAAPIVWGRQILGILNVLDDTPRVFSEDDITLLQRFTPLAAAAMESTRLYDDLQEQMEQLMAAEAQLVQSAKLAAIGELAAGVAHELNNPLTSIVGFAEIISSEATLPPSCSQDVEKIATEALRACEIVRNLLDFSRRKPPLRQPADINHVLGQVLDMFRYELETSGVILEEIYAPNIDTLRLDVGQMKQVLINLLTNAFQSMPKGGELRVRTAQAGDGVTVAITDTGLGIHPEMQQRIFDAFFTTKPSGVGLGLSVSQGIVQKHGGEITVESEPGQGSTFTVWLPLSG
jgi:signal transduction histidine kinase